MADTTPQTVWTPKGGEGEFTSGSVNNIVDASGNQLADSTSNLIADSGNIFTPTAASVWSSNDGS